MNTIKKINFSLLFLLYFFLVNYQVKAQIIINLKSKNVIKNSEEFNEILNKQIVNTANKKPDQTVNEPINNPDHVSSSTTIIMQVGSAGENVRRLQEELSNLGFFNFQISGYFGSLTEEAVREFQQANNLIPTGIVDKITANLILDPSDFLIDSHKCNDQTSSPFFENVILSNPNSP